MSFLFFASRFRTVSLDVFNLIISSVIINLELLRSVLSALYPWLLLVIITPYRSPIWSGVLIGFGQENWPDDYYCTAIAGECGILVDGICVISTGLPFTIFGLTGFGIANVVITGRCGRCVWFAGVFIVVVSVGNEGNGIADCDFFCVCTFLWSVFVCIAKGHSWNCMPANSVATNYFRNSIFLNSGCGSDQNTYSAISRSNTLITIIWKRGFRTSSAVKSFFSVLEELELVEFIFEPTGPSTSIHALLDWLGLACWVVSWELFWGALSWELRPSSSCSVLHSFLKHYLPHCNQAVGQHWRKR